MAALLSAAVLVGGAFLLDEISQRWLSDEVGVVIMWLTIAVVVVILLATTQRRRERPVTHDGGPIGGPFDPVVVGDAGSGEVLDTGDACAGGDPGGGH